MMPKRIQRRRSKGWKLPAGAVCVTRPGKWGNPYLPGRHGAEWAVTMYEHAILNEYKAMVAVTAEDVRRELAGKDLACWCPLDRPCHADILLRIANS